MNVQTRDDLSIPWVNKEQTFGTVIFGLKKNPGGGQWSFGEHAVVEMMIRLCNHAAFPVRSESRRGIVLCNCCLVELTCLSRRRNCVQKARGLLSSGGHQLRPAESKEKVLEHADILSGSWWKLQGVKNFACVVAKQECWLNFPVVCDSQVALVFQDERSVCAAGEY